MGINSWKSELSLIDEAFGKNPKFPLATQIEYQKYEFNKQNELLKDLTLAQQEEIKNTTKIVCGSIENGFNKLYEVNSRSYEKIINNLEDIKFNEEEINRSLDQINSTLEWGFSSLLENLTINNNRLNQIIQLLNIPDSQKQRKHHIEQGFDFMKKAKLNSDLYEYAKDNFEKAIGIENTDYLSLQQLGIIHFYNSKFLDLAISKEYFLKSITLSEADINTNKNIQNRSSFVFTFNPTKITATSYLHLSRIYFKNSEYQMAYDSAIKGIKILNLLSLNYDLSIYAAKLNDEVNALKYLKTAISKDRFLAVKAVNDANLIKNPYVTNFLNELTEKYIKIAKEDFNKIKLIAPYDTSYMERINYIEKLINQNNYLDALEALEAIGYFLNN